MFELSKSSTFWSLDYKTYSRFVNLLAEYVSRIKGGENIADLRETEGNQYPVSKELV